MLRYWQHLEQRQKESLTLGDSYLFRDLVASFGVQWDDESIQRHDKSSSHKHAGHLAAPASSWEQQLVSPTFLEDGENVMETHEWDDDPHEHEEEEQEWVEEADGFYGNDFPQYDTSLEEQFGTLETAEAFATSELENASSEMISAARCFMDARKIGGSSEISTRLLSGGWNRCFRRLAINDTTCLSGNTGFQ